MKKVYITLILAVLVALAYFLFFKKESFEQILCTADALICPDGSYVGRTGPNCEFAKCPTTQAVENNTIGSLKVGETEFINGVQITLNKIVEDSRCPSDVVCIWAGRLVVNVTLKSDTDTETVDLGTDKPAHNFDIFKVSVDSATPKPVSTRPLTPIDYNVVFTVLK